MAELHVQSLSKLSLCDNLATKEPDLLSDVNEKFGSNIKSPTMSVTVIYSMAELEIFQLAAAGVDLVAVDCEGVNLSRFGSLTLVSVALDPFHIYLFDIIQPDIELQVAQLDTLRGILENPVIMKLIHDCHQDSDALLTQQKIRLANVFDTSACILTLQKVKSISLNIKKTKLNDSLKQYDCPVNPNRDAGSNIYKENHAFWAERPLTEFMIAYASGLEKLLLVLFFFLISKLFICKGDVGTLFDLHLKLLAEISRSSGSTELLASIMEESNRFLGEFRDLPLSLQVDVPKNKMWYVIGENGSGIARIESNSKTRVTRSVLQSGFMVYAASDADLQKAKNDIEASYQKAKKKKRAVTIKKDY